MGNKEDMEMEYVAAFVPDMPRIIEYVKKAKGPNRTMAKFAADCSGEGNVSVSASTLSRIVNLKKAKPLSEELIRAMVKNAADPEEISFYGFMRANGMIPKEEQENSEKRRSDLGMTLPDLSTIRENENRTIKNIIGDELNARDYMLQFLPNIPLEDNPRGSFLLGRYRCSFVVRAHGIEPKYWGFHVYRSLRDDKESSLSEKHLEFALSRKMRSWSWIFLRDQWESELFSDIKIKNTFLFTDSEAFELFCKNMQEVSVNTNMSAMLIDLQKQEIVSEIPFKRRDGRVFESLLDKKKVEYDYSDEDYD